MVARHARNLLGLALTALLLAAAAQPLGAQTQEYEIKAAFLLNFAQFIQWPAEAFASPDAPFTIGVLGDDPFGAALDDTIRGETIANHKMTVRRADSIEGLEGCQMIFVCKNHKSRVSVILEHIGARPTLTVSDIDDFARHGGVICFYTSSGKLRFEINPGAAQRAGLKISSQLLSLGRIVGPEEVEK